MKLGRKQAIRMKCIDCCAGQKREVKLCTAYSCPLWPFRLGVEVKQDSDTDNDDEDDSEE